jgi:hypothetical protein
MQYSCFVRIRWIRNPDSVPDWILGAEGVEVAQAVSDLIDNLLITCNECS